MSFGAPRVGSASISASSTRLGAPAGPIVARIPVRASPTSAFTPHAASWRSSSFIVSNSSNPASGIDASRKASFIVSSLCERISASTAVFSSEIFMTSPYPAPLVHAIYFAAPKQFIRHKVGSTTLPLDRRPIWWFFLQSLLQKYTFLHIDLEKERI